MLLIIVFLVAIQSVLALWAQVGGQYHLDLMFWPWKLGITLAASALITLIARESVRAARIITRRTLVYLLLLMAVMVTAGLVTLYYHQNEPTDDDQDTGESTYTTFYQTRQDLPPRTIG